MATTTQPTIAHGIAVLHPDVELPSSWRWGPDWTLPPARSGRWAISSIYNAAVRVEFDDGVARLESTYAKFLAARDALEAAREALSAEEEKRRDEWLAWADKSEGAAFVRHWTARKRREHGDMPKIAAGAYVRDGWRSTGLWHIATGRVDESYRDHDRLSVGTECPAAYSIDLGDPESRSVAQTMNPEGNVCKRCQSRIANRVEAPERQGL